MNEPVAFSGEFPNLCVLHGAVRRVLDLSVSARVGGLRGGS